MHVAPGVEWRLKTPIGICSQDSWTCSQSGLMVLWTNCSYCMQSKELGI